MDALGGLVVLVAIVIAVTALSRRTRLLAPIVLVVVGLGVSLIKGFPAPTLTPDFVLVGILPPLLYVSALQMSVPAFRVNLRPILLLAAGLVVFTTIVVGYLVHALLPSVPLAACFAFGAVVAPSDAISATAITKQTGLPRQLVTILEGESLLNDASAIVLFRVASAAAIGLDVGPSRIAGEILLDVGGGLAVGALGAVIFGFLHRKTTDPLLDNSLSLLTPFALTLVAQPLHASAVVAVVVAGLYLGHRLPTLMSAASRLQMDAFWRMVTFLLEGLVFLLVGLQPRNVVTEPRIAVVDGVLVTLAVLVTVIVTRFAWVIAAACVSRVVASVRHGNPPLPWSVQIVLGWAGMRGVVTLATALALPLTLAGGETYPRELFVILAFVVIIGTLVLQGMTLPMVARWLRTPVDDPREDIIAEAAVQERASKAALERLEREAGEAPPAVVARLRQLTELRTNVVWERLGRGGDTPSAAYVRLRRAMLDTERGVFRGARDAGVIDERVLVDAQREMDLEESLMERTDLQ